MQGMSAGWIELICGPMFSGKTEELIRRGTQAVFAGQEVQAFKHSLDAGRYAEAELASHSGARMEAVAVSDARDILALVKPDVEVVVIDEVHFFDRTIADVCNALADEGKRVIVAGLDMDFRGEPFGPVPLLIAQAEMVDKLQTVCAICKARASFSQRLINGQPAAYDEPVVVVGAAELYEARCRHCHQVPRPREGESARGRLKTD